MTRFFILILIIISNNCFSQDALINKAKNPGSGMHPSPFRIINADTIKMNNINGYAIIVINISNKAAIKSFNILKINTINKNNGSILKYFNTNRDKIRFDHCPKEIKPYYNVIREFVDSLIIQTVPDTKPYINNKMYIKTIIISNKNKINYNL